MLFKEHESKCKKNAKTIVCSEKKKRYVAHNNNNHNVYQYQIDGDIISSTDTRNRCDYLLEDETTKCAYLIELKGRHLLHALEQIESTINDYYSLFKNQEYTILPRIVYGSNTHGIRSHEYIKFKSKYPKARAETDFMEESL